MTKKPAKDSRDKLGGRVVGWLLLGLVVLFGGAYAAAHFAAADKAPRGTTVAGIDVGGRPHSEIEDAVRAGLAERVQRPITYRLGESESVVEPSAFGLEVDYAATAKRVGGAATWDPAQLWRNLTDGEDVEPVVTVDDATFAATLAEIQGAMGKAPVSGEITFVDGTVDTVTPVDGRGIDPEASQPAIVEAYLAAEPAPVELSDTVLKPEIGPEALQSALDTFGNPAVASGVVLTFQGQPIKLSPEQYTPALSMKPVDGALVPELDAEALNEVVAPLVRAQGAPREATIKIVAGKPQIVPSEQGNTFDREQLAASFLGLVAAPEGERRLELAVVQDDPEVDTAALEAMGIKERVSTFTTYFPYAEYRNVNIGRASQLVNGTLLEPGETFSLNETVGERTRANGFTEGMMIADGVFKSDLGGGVSQMATTTFNAMFFAGLEDVEHKPHSFYISRYPVGREATVAWGAVDLRFRNDTEHGVYIQSWTKPSTPSSQGSVTVSMWSTKTWDITTSTGGRYAFTSPATRTLTGPTCIPNAGYGGFDIDVKRYFRKPGSKKLVRTENFTTTYTPSDTVICK